MGGGGGGAARTGGRGLARIGRGGVQCFFSKFVNPF